MRALIQRPWQFGLGQFKKLLLPSGLPCPSAGEVDNMFVLQQVWFIAQHINRIISVAV